MAWYTGDLAQHPRRANFVAKVIYYGAVVAFLTVVSLIFQAILQKHPNWTVKHAQTTR